MKNLLIAINAKYIHPNLAIRLLKKNTTYPTDIIEYSIKDDPNKIVEYIVTNKYEFIGFSCYIWNIELVKKIITNLRIYPIKIMLGGPEVSYNASEYLQNNLCDYVIKNEGEEAYHLLLAHIYENFDIKQVPNLYYLDNFTFDKLVDLTKTKMAYDLLEDVENRIMYIETSRGCPYKCGYCMASLDNKVRFFSLEEIKKQLLILIEKGAHVFKFLDRTFNANKRNFISLIDFIIAHHKATNSFQFEITGDLLDVDVIEYLNSKAPKNLFRFEIGIQSTNIETNLLVHRIQDNQKLFNNIKLIQQANVIDLHLDLIAGLPKEDYNSFKNTFNEVLALRPKELQLGFLKLLHGTALYIEASLYNYTWMNQAPYEIISNDSLSQLDIANIHLAEDAFEKYYNSCYCKKTINYILDNIKNGFDFFYHLGVFYKENYTGGLANLFLTIDSFIKKYYIDLYDHIHSLLIFDYLTYHNLKPSAWWNELLTSKEKNNTIRKIHDGGSLPYLLDKIYKYSMIVPLKSHYLLALYFPSEKLILKIEMS